MMMRYARAALCSGVVLFAAGIARADEAALDALRQAQGALKQVTTVRYAIEVRPGGAIEGQAPTLVGSLLMQAAPGLPIPVRLAGEGTITQPSAPAPTRFRSTFDGETIRSLDFELRVMQSSGIAPGADSLLLGTYDMLLDMFVTEQPLEAELNAFSATLEGQADVGGVTTDVVLVTYDQDANAGRTRFYLATTDHLPRKIETLFTVGGQDASISYTLSGIEVNPAVGPDAFALATPEGWVVSEFDINSMGLLPTGIEAPDFTLQERNGEPMRLSDLRGKVVMLDFWATWCAPCKAAMPIIQRLHEKYASEGLVVFGVITDETDQNAALQYVDGKGYTYRQLLNGETLRTTYRIQGLPVLYLVGADGAIVFRELGMNEAELTEAIEAALHAHGG